MAAAGVDIRDDKDLKHTMKRIVKKAVKAAVDDAVQEVKTASQHAR